MDKPLCVNCKHHVVDDVCGSVCAAFDKTVISPVDGSQFLQRPRPACDDQRSWLADFASGILGPRLGRSCGVDGKLFEAKIIEERAA